MLPKNFDKLIHVALWIVAILPNPLLSVLISRIGIGASFRALGLELQPILLFLLFAKKTINLMMRVTLLGRFLPVNPHSNINPSPITFAYLGSALKAPSL
ncbi:hypothetical protein Metme_3228 [Methylomonas methanica MC09]|uniref:Uncharacterized protein n=1 Tax=Methylomonas methanica (strain DSM 25384 / MC09) TaxID=857087 RepID=G0A4L0_METMM|nr:hypothetical protein Metme_3228 [Methylomonas methanica MC09]